MEISVYWNISHYLEMMIYFGWFCSVKIHDLFQLFTFFTP